MPSVALPPGYVIGPEDMLAILFWRDKEMSGEYVVRPDGQITLPLLSDIQAAGLTPEQLRDSLTKAASVDRGPDRHGGREGDQQPEVFITGMVGKSGAYPLTSPTTVAQLISVAWGLQEFADAKNIMIVRTENGRQVAYKFNFKDFSRARTWAEHRPQAGRSDHRALGRVHQVSCSQVHPMRKHYLPIVCLLAAALVPSEVSAQAIGSDSPPPESVRRPYRGLFGGASDPRHRRP